MYKVIKYFTDLKDNHHPYNVGDVYPRVGLRVTDERIAELSSAANIQGIPLIEKVTESLSSAIPALPEEIPVEQEPSSKETAAGVEEKKPRRSRNKK